MHELEYKILNLSEEVRRGVISARRLVRTLRTLATDAHDYIPDPILSWNEDGTRNYQADQERRLHILGLEGES
jgi:hypothetical protein